MHLDDLILKTSMLQTEIQAKEEDDDEAECKESIHLTYVEIVDEATIFIADRHNFFSSHVRLW